MPFENSAAIAPLRYVRSVVRAQPEPLSHEWFSLLQTQGDQVSFVEFGNEAGQTAPSDPQVLSIIKVLDISGSGRVAIRVPFGGHHLRCDMVFDNRPKLAVTAYRLGAETLFDWRVNGKTFSRRQEVISVEGKYLPSDAQFDAAETLLRLQRPLPVGLHEYKRMARQRI